MDHHWSARTGPVRPVLWAGGQVLLSGARRQTMFERFTDRSRRIVVLAQEEARRLDHNWIGTEHILLGLIKEGDGVAARALESIGISLDAVRQKVEEIIGRGQQAPSEHIPFTPRAKKVLELSLREALQLGDNYIGTEHILLGLVREGDGVAAQVLVTLGADLNRVHQEVIRLVPAHPAEEPEPGVRVRLELVEQRLTAIEQRVGIEPDTGDLAERWRQLADEVERLGSLLRQHGIDPQDEPAGSAGD
jgi:ATP-dependent Clp protease ATP-binding subunit ClpA